MSTSTNTSLEITDFFKYDYVDQASYDNLRKISSCVDGLKNSNRKVIHTLLDKNIKELLKVQQLASKASEYTDYLHGSLDGVIVSLGQNFVGSNQIPLIHKKGNFGTRAITTPSASRYIYAKSSPILNHIFLKDDRSILNHQIFEGEQIEPRYFVPTIPMLFVNGNRGVSSGFSQLIQPRSLKDILEVLAQRLSNKTKDFKSFDNKPMYVKGFNGNIERDLEQKENFRWIIEGSYEVKKNEIYINELPLGTDLMEYVQFLDDLKENKLIKNYKDLCDGDDFKFIVTFKESVVNDKEKIIKLLKLRTFITENFTSLGCDNKIREFNKPSEALEHYYDVKIKSLGERKDLLIKNLESKISLKSEQVRFIEYVIASKLDLKKLKTSEVIQKLEGFEFLKFEKSYDYLLRLPITSLQKDKIESLKNEVEQLNKELNELKATTVETLWLNDLKNLAKALKDEKLI